jgi:L-alanine-DL-glutamate epimerase-like enolase superfamily enzyme
MKVGLADSREDFRRVSAVRKAIPDDVILMADANQKWDLMQASQATGLLQELDLSWIEEPLHPDDIKAHRVLKQRTNPVALNTSTPPMRSGTTSKIMRLTSCRWMCAALAASRRG